LSYTYRLSAWLYATFVVRLVTFAKFKNKSPLLLLLLKHIVQLVASSSARKY